ncbi:hypothetical protein N7509_002382, partial [Penicillium cosmopolitanum]
NTQGRATSLPCTSVSVDENSIADSLNYLGVSRPSSSIKAPSFQSWPFIPDRKGSPSRGSVSEFHNEKARSEQLASLADIICALRFLPIIKKLLHDYFVYIGTALVPKTIVNQLLEMVCNDLTKSGYIKQDSESCIGVYNVSQLAESILYSTSVEVAISATMDVKNFCAIFCEDNLRVETLGLLYTLAARASLYSSTYAKVRNDSFIQEMCWCSNSSLRLARELAPQTTDPVIWLAHENLQLMSLFEGDASLNVWRRVSDLATDLYALGLNREATYSSESIPFFLAECRRRTFVRAYYLDKIFATVFNRPPRISSRHADCKLPLDIPDDALFTISSPEVLSEIKTNLTHDGWNTNGIRSTATWARLRYILGEFREETAEYQIRSTPSIDSSKLRDLSDRCRQTWCSLPAHLMYDPNCWTSDLPPAVCYLHGKVYLSYLHIHFQIYRMLGECHTSTVPELLEVSANMLETVMLMANSLNRGNCQSSPRDLPEIFLIYGLPSAIVLTTALETNIRDPAQPLPPNIKSSSVIRNISVLVSQLENVSSPDETNHGFCVQASKAIARKLDTILDTSTTFAPRADIITGSGRGSELTTLQERDYSDSENHIVDFSELDHLDFSAWVIDLDLVTDDGVWDTV